MNIKETEIYLAVPKGTLYHWVRQGKIPVIRLGGRCLRFDLGILEKWVTEQSSLRKEVQQSQGNP